MCSLRSSGVEWHDHLSVVRVVVRLRPVPLPGRQHDLPAADGPLHAVRRAAQNTEDHTHQ